MRTNGNRHSSLKDLKALILCFVFYACEAVIQAQGTPILVYHRFDPAIPGPTTVRTAVFESQLVWLEDHHYQVIPLQELVRDLLDHKEITAQAVVLTADDGNESVYTQMFPVIQKHRVPVTLFIYPSAISNASYALTWEQLRKMQASGLVQIESHTYWHPNFRKERVKLSPLEYKAFVKVQLERSKQTLENRLGIEVSALAWPYGIYDSALENAARQAGYQAAFGFAGGRAQPGGDLYAIPRIPVSDTDTGIRFSELLVHPKRTGRTE